MWRQLLRLSDRAPAPRPGTNGQARGMDALELPPGDRASRSMMNPAWPERIVFGHVGASLENGRKTGLSPSKIAEGFWPPLRAKPNCAARRSLRPRVHPRPADHFVADERDAGIRHSPRLEDCSAGQRNWLGQFPAREARETAGGRTAPGDRCGPGLEAGPLGPVGHGPACYPAGIG